MGPGRLVALLCAAEVLSLLGFATFPALIPIFVDEWAISNTEAGTISGAYFVGYMAAVTVLVALTDRRDAWAIYTVSALCIATAGFGFALFADGFWTAVAFQALAGVGLAGTYMPGLKILSDRIEGPRQSRFVSFYTATFSIGAALSFLLAGQISAWVDWSWAFAAVGAGGVASAVLMLVFVPRGGRPTKPPDTRLFDFRPVLRSRAAMAYILGYAGHVWELLALRGWVVAFLSWSASREGGGAMIVGATVVAAVGNVIGLPSSIIGNELAMRFGRRRVLLTLMLLSAAMAVVIRLGADWSYQVLAVLCVLYAIPLMGDSAALTAGAVSAAPEGHRGATLAIHSTLGFGCGFLGTFAVGFVLDLSGGASTAGWLAAFVTVGAGAALGALAVAILGRPSRSATG